MAYYPVGILICLLAYFICGFVIDNCVDARKTYKGKFSRQPTKYELVVPHKATEKGDFRSHVIPHHYSRNYYENKSLHGADDMIHYVVPIFGERHHLQLVPNNRIISPGMVVEIHDDSKISNSKIRKLGNVQCHYKGSIRGHDDSSVAVSTCYGLSGLLRTNRGNFLIEPAEGFNELSGKEHPHLIYQHQKPFQRNAKCETTEKIHKTLAKKTCESQFKNVCPTNISEYHIEVMLVLDKTMLDYHVNVDIENYVLTVFNMAHLLYHDSSLGLNVNLAIVRIIRLEEEEHKMNLAMNKNVKKTLEYFEEWQHEMNPGDDTHPNHHDVAILLTRIDICGDDDNCGILGASVMGGICDPKHQAAVCEDSGLRLGFVIAHEIGHTLAIPHDESKEAACNATLSDGLSTVMNPSVNIRTSQWSPCSARFLKLFIEQGYADCLLDPPIDHGFEMPDILPGVMYGADFQCKELLTPTATLCDVGVECDNLICFVEEKGCIETHTMAASGTNCGEKKWCFRGKCLEVGERPGAIDGGWSSWSKWSKCSRTCGSGVRSQERYCTNPSPARGGKYCSGSHKRNQICSTQLCQFGSPSFRNVQCAEFNQWVYPEDNKVHQWKAYHINNDNPCILFCVNDVGDVASLRPRVEDGTKCVRGMRDICVDGLCRGIPCDLDLESNAVEDWCGVCRGDGTSCIVHSDQKHFCHTDKNSQIVNILQIPKYSVNIKVEETVPSDSKLQVVDKCSNLTVVEGSIPGAFNVTGARAWLGNIRTKQEALSIPGNITSDIIIRILLLDNTTVKYSYGIPNSVSRQPDCDWDYLDWSKCSSACGPGTEESIPRCREKVAGFVDDVHCKDKVKPKDRIRPCEIASCVPRWMIGDWKECSPCPSGKHSRIVRCVIPTGEGETEIDIIHEYRCVPPKPKNKEKCMCSRNDKRDVKKSQNNCTTTTLDDILDAQRLSIIIDKENPKDVELTIHEDRQFKETTDTDSNSTQLLNLKEKDALKFIDKLNKDLSGHRPKI